MFILSIFMVSCGYETPVIDGSSPYIIKSQSVYSNTHSRYYSDISSGAEDNLFGMWYPCIIAPTGVYSVGDTIKFSK